MRKTPILALLAGAVFMVAGNAVAADAPRKIRPDLTVEDLGTPLQRRRMTRAYVYKAPDNGQLRLFMSLCADNGLIGDPRAAAMGADARILLLDFNLETGKVFRALGPMGGGVNVYLHSNGMLYFMSGRPTALSEFNPRTGNVRIIGRMTDHYFDASFSAIEADDGRLYLGTYGGHAVRYDPKSDSLENLGLMGRTKRTYLTAVAVKDGRLYCMPWAFGSGGAVVYDLEAKTQKHYFLNTEHLDTGKAGTLWLGRDGEVYFQKRGEGSFRFVKGEPMKLEGRPKVKPVAIGPRECRNVWPPHKVKKALGIELDLSGVDPNTFNNGTVTIRWRKAAAQDAPQPEWRTITCGGVELFPNCPRSVAVTPEGKIIGVGGSYGPVFEFDPDAGKSRLVGCNPGSIYDVLVDGNIVYFSGYSSLLAVYDRTKPWTLSPTNRRFGDRSINPYITGAAKRATHMAVAADGRLYCGGNHSRHLSGAQVVIYDPKTGEVENLRKEVEDCHFRDLAAVDKGRLVVISSRRNKDRTAVLHVYDTRSRKIVQRIEAPFEAPHWGNLFPGDGTTVLGLVKLDPRDEHGKVHYESLLYKYDVAASRLVFQKRLPGKAFNGPSFFDYQSNHRRFCLGPDGCGWLFIGFDMTRIHPDGTVETVLRLDVPGQILFVGDDLYMYNGGRQSWGGFSSILRIRNVFE